jgi:anti-anti-sigma regulatory factor
MSNREGINSTMETQDKLCKPSGELTIFEAAEFKESLIRILACDGLVCLDLSQVTRVDTAAIQLMWAARKLGRLLVTGISQELQAKLTQLGFSEPLSE